MLWPAPTASWHGCIHYGWLSASFRSIEWESAEASVQLQHAQVAVHYLSCWLSKTNSSVLQTAVCVTCGALTAGPWQPICVRVAILYVYLQKSSGNSLFSRHCRYSESKLNCIAAIVRQVRCSNIFLQFFLIFHGFAYQIFMRNRRRKHKVTIKFLL